MMTKGVVRLSGMALILVGSILVVGCGSGPENASVAPNVTPPPAASPIVSSKTGPEGYVDKMDCDAATGWVWIRDQPQQAIQVELYADDKLQGKGTADRFRKDLKDAGFGTGNYAYSIPIPAALKDGKPHAIKLKVEGGDYQLVFFKIAPSLTCSP